MYCSVLCCLNRRLKVSAIYCTSWCRLGCKLESSPTILMQFLLLWGICRAHSPKYLEKCVFPTTAAPFSHHVTALWDSHETCYNSQLHFWAVLPTKQLGETKKSRWGGVLSLFLSRPLMLCWACSSGKSLHPRSTCRSLAFCVRRCEPTKCLTFPYRPYNPQVVMEIHWVAVAAELQWREERSKGRRSISSASFVSSGSLWPSLLIKRALTKGVCWLQAESRTDYSNNRDKPRALFITQ